MADLRVEIPLQPKQGELLELIKSSKATWLGYGGSRGGTKSHGGRAMILQAALEVVARYLILRRTYDLVRENHIEPLLTQYPYMRDWYRVGDKELRIPSGSVIAFRHAENRGDVEGMIGKEYRMGLVDQAEAFSERELNTIKSIIRWPGVDPTQCKLILTFNPGNIGHAFLKRIFFDKIYQGNERAEDYAFLQAFGWDNWEWARVPLEQDGFTAEDYYSWDEDRKYQYFITRTQYGRDLNALPQAMRIGWLLGRMDQFAGQYYDLFSPDRHVMPCEPQEWHTRSIGIDWGFAHNAAAYWSSQVAPKLTAFYREFVGKGRSPKALAQEIVDRTPLDERPKVRHIFLSHDAFAKRDERDTIAQQMAEIFRANDMPYPAQATKDVIGRATLLYDMLRGEPDPNNPTEFIPSIVIDPKCKELINTIPMVCRDEDHPEKPLKFDGDDAYDGALYSLTYRLKPAEMPRELVLAEQAAKIQDPVARWFWLQKQRRQQPANLVIVPDVRLPWQSQ